MESAVVNDDEIKRIEDGLAKVQAKMEMIGQHMQSMGPNFIHMPNPLPAAANELLDTMSALKKYRDDYIRGLKSLEQSQREAAGLKEKNEGKKESLRKREEDFLAKSQKHEDALQKREGDLAKREREWELETAGRQTLSASINTRSKEFESRVEKHNEAVNAHNEQVGALNAERTSLQKREDDLRSSTAVYSKQKQELDAAMAVHKALSDSLETSTAEHKAKVEAHSDAVKTHLEQVGQFNEKKATLEEREDRVLERERKHESDSKELERGKRELETEIARQKESFDELQSQIEAHKKQVDEDTKSAAKTRNVLKEFEAQLEKQKQGLDKQASEQMLRGVDEVGLERKEEYLNLREADDDKRSELLDQQSEEQRDRAKELSDQAKEQSHRAKELSHREAMAKDADAAIRRMQVHKLQTFQTMMDMISPVVMGLRDELGNLSEARKLAAGISTDISKARATTAGLDTETSSLADKLKSLSIDTTKTGDAVEKRNAVVDVLMSKLDRVAQRNVVVDDLVSKLGRVAAKLDPLNSIVELIDSVQDRMDNVAPAVDSSLSQIDELMTDLELLRPHIPNLFDRESRKRFAAAAQSAPSGSQAHMSSQTLTSEQAQARKAVVSRIPVPTPAESLQAASVLAAASQTSAPRPAEPAQETSVVATASQTPVVVSPGQKRKHTSAQSTSHKRHTSSSGRVSRAGSRSPSPLAEERSRTRVSFDEALRAVDVEDEEQTERETDAGSTQTAPQQPVVTQEQTEVDNIWGQLVFSPTNWAATDEEKFRASLRLYQSGKDSSKPLKMFDNCSKRQAKGIDTCWITHSMKSKGHFATPGQACNECARLGRVCLKIEKAPAGSGKPWLVTLRPHPVSAQNA
ncbi:MAG: hypothetical protein Q9195_003720 [Heterodermia aff. obscurata]